MSGSAGERPFDWPGFFRLLMLAASTVVAGAASGQNHFSVVVGAVGHANSAVNAEASPEGEIYDGQNACCNNVKLMDDAIQMGLVDPGDDVDGYSYLHPMGFLPGGNNAGLDYSVAPGVAGMTPGTIYRGGFFNRQGIIPPIGLGLTNTDDLNAYCFQKAAVPFYFSLAAGSNSLVTIPAKPGDILDWGPAALPAVVVITYDRLGLNIADDIDALAVWDTFGSGVLDTGDDVLFSLAPGSPSLAAIPANASDVLRATITAAANPNAPVVYTSGAFLGIPAGGDMDALDDTDSFAIKELVLAPEYAGGSTGGNAIHEYRLREVLPGPDGLYDTPDDIVTPLPGELVDFQSLDPGIATVNPPSDVTGASGEVFVVIDFVSLGTTHIEAHVPIYAIDHYAAVVVAPPVPVVGIAGAVLLVLALFAVSARRLRWVAGAHSSR
jgi:hypothetical protein